MKKIFDSHAFKVQEDISYYLDPAKVVQYEWGEPAFKEELIELFTEWPEGTSLYDVFPHCRPCFTYPVIDDNIYLYNMLTRHKDFKGLFDPLDYFNLLYEKFRYILDNVHKDPEYVINSLLKTNLVKRKLHFLLYSLHFIIQGVNGSVTADRMWPEGITTLKNRKLGHLHLNIIDSYQTLESELKITTENTDIPNSRLRNNCQVISEQLNLTMNQVALMYFYKGVPITESGGAEIAEKFGFCSKTSGHKLYQVYTDFSTRSYRMSIPETKKTFENKISLFESVLNMLDDNSKYKMMLSDELNLLLNTYKSRYPER